MYSNVKHFASTFVGVLTFSITRHTITCTTTKHIWTTGICGSTWNDALTIVISHDTFVSVHLFLYEEVHNSFLTHPRTSDSVQMGARNCQCFGGAPNADTAKPKTNCEKRMTYSDSAGSKTPTHYFSRIYSTLGRAGGGRHLGEDSGSW